MSSAGPRVESSGCCPIGLALGPVIDMGRFGVNGSWACVLRDGRLFDTPTLCKPRTEEFTPQAQVLLYPAAKTMLNPDALVVKPEPGCPVRSWTGTANLLPQNLTGFITTSFEFKSGSRLQILQEHAPPKF